MNRNKYIMLLLPDLACNHLREKSELTGDEIAALSEALRREGVEGHTGFHIHPREIYLRTHLLGDLFGYRDCHNVTFEVPCGKGESESSGNARRLFCVANEDGDLLTWSGAWTDTDDTTDAMRFDSESEAEEQARKMHCLMPCGSFEAVARYERVMSWPKAA